MLQDLKTEGITLKVVPYQEKAAIVTLFTPLGGLLTCFAKQLRGVSALVQGEWVVTKRTKGLPLLAAETVTSRFPTIRSSYAHMQAAGEMARLVLQTQQANKEAALLYQLLIDNLHKLHDFCHPETLSLSFSLKLLRLEGIWYHEPLCAACHKPLAQMVIYNGEPLCERHASQVGIRFDINETELVHQLALSRSYSTLKSLLLSPHLQKSLRETILNLLNL
ncbi:MAG: DNA repair protein RecO [Chlamydiia bacterium]|nr:DNA repair protein RecO [Chlamydiia bacterium]